MDFVIHITSSTDNHRLVRFTVPTGFLEGTKNYTEVIDKAGWWYMNRIDFCSCTGPYEWTVFPANLLDNIKTAS